MDGVVFVVGEVPIGVGSSEGGSHEGDSLREFATNGEYMSIGTSEGDSLREFATNGEHMSIGTSVYATISFFLSFLFFLNFPDLSLSSL